MVTTVAAGLVNALFIGAVLLWLTPVARFLPFNALAAIVITGVVPVIDFAHLFHLLKVCDKVQHVRITSCQLTSSALGAALLSKSF